MEPLSCEGGLPWRDGELLLTFLKEVSLFLKLHFWPQTSDDKPLGVGGNDLVAQVEHKGLSGEIKLEEGTRTHFQLDVMDKVSSMIIINIITITIIIIVIINIIIIIVNVNLRTHFQLNVVDKVSRVIISTPGDPIRPSHVSTTLLHLSKMVFLVTAGAEGKRMKNDQKSF